MAQCLAGNQQVVSPDWFSLGFQRRSHAARNFRILGLESQQAHRTREECLHQSRIGFRAGTLRNPIPKLKSYDGRDYHLRVLSQCLLQPGPDRRRLIVDQRNTSVGIEQILHLKILRRGVAVWFLPLPRNCPSLTRSSSANHSPGSAISGSRRTPSASRRTRTWLPSKRNSRGSRTAWLRPLRNSLAIPGAGIRRFLRQQYIPQIAIMNSINGIYHIGGLARKITRWLCRAAAAACCPTPPPPTPTAPAR